MKRSKTSNKTKLALVMGVSFGIMAASPMVLAQDFDLESDVIENEEFDVEGEFLRKKDFSKVRKNLESRTNNMIDKKIEAIRLKHEKELRKDIGNLFAGQPVTDELTTSSAATQKTQAVAPVVQKPNNAGFKITPYAGATLVGSENVSYDSKISAGIGMGADMTDNIALGVNLQYTTMDITSFDNYFNQFNNGGFYNYGFNYFNNNGFNRINYKQFSLEANGKFYLTGRDYRFRPYAGLGLGLTRSQLDYEEQSQQQQLFAQFNNGQVIEPQYRSNYMTGVLLLGSDIAFTDTIGLNFEAKYSRGLTSGFGTSATDVSGASFLQPGQEGLERIGRDIEESNFIGLHMGLNVNF